MKYFCPCSRTCDDDSGSLLSIPPVSSSACWVVASASLTLPFLVWNFHFMSNVKWRQKSPSMLGLRYLEKRWLQAGRKKGFPELSDILAWSRASATQNKGTKNPAALSFLENTVTLKVTAGRRNPVFLANPTISRHTILLSCGWGKGIGCGPNVTYTVFSYQDLVDLKKSLFIVCL